MTITREQLNSLPRFDQDYAEMVEVTPMENFPDYGGDWVRWEDLIALFEGGDKNEKLSKQ